MGPAKATLAGSMHIPLSLVDVESVKKDLTIHYLPMGEEEATEILAYKLHGDSISVPRQYGLSLCARLEIDYNDETSAGKPARFPKVPEPREYQVEPLEEVETCFDDYYDFIFRARTGWGKTIGSLIVAARIGLTTLIVVDQENLKDQWIDSLTKHFGFTVDQIGIIQGDKCSYKNKAVTVAMVQTLTQREFPQEVYDAFGLMIVDEVHIIGAPTFSTILLDFSASYRFGVSATPRRRDALQKLIEYNLGKVRVYIEDEHDPSAVYVAEHPTVYSAYANKAPKIGRFINEVTEDGSRNLLVAEAITYLYDTGRDILVLSDRIEQLRHLESLCYYLGIPADEMGVYAGYSLVYLWEKQANPLRRPEGLVKHAGEGEVEPGYYYTPVSLQLISKRAKKPDLERIKTTARIIFATYGKFSKGVDEPRLCGGVDASPRSKSEQEQGRILRKLDNKLKPIWITVTDTSSYRSLFALLGRIADYVKNNSVVSKWSLDRGKERCNVTELRRNLQEEVTRLKSSRIETNSDGLNIVETKRPVIQRGQLPERLTRPTVFRSSRMASSVKGRSAR